MRIVMWIALLCLATSATFRQQTPPLVPDSIFHNGSVVTVDSSFSIREAFAVKGDEFLAVGSNAAVRALAGPTTHLIDLRGHTVIPGLMDNHTHLYHAALDKFWGVDLIGVQSLAEMMARIRRAVTGARPGEVIVTTGGWNPNEFPERRGPTREDLDEISSEQPIVVFRGRGTASLNSAALKAAGISRETQSLAGSPIQKHADGEPVGTFTGPASVTAAVGEIVPAPSAAEAKEMIRKTQGQLNEWGLTSIREVELPPDGMRGYQALSREGGLTVRVSMGLRVAANDADRMGEILSPWGVGTGFGGKWLRLDSVGELGMDVSDNAYYREPYADRPKERGSMRISLEQLRRAMILVNRYGWRPSIHVMGDATLDRVLDAFEAADADIPIHDRRWIVEHIPQVHPDQMQRMARLGVLISAQIQPYDGAAGMTRRLGSARTEQAVPLRDLLDHKLIVSSGSDWGGGRDANPFENIYFYVTRKTREGTVLGAHQRISRKEALRVLTINNAYMTFEEDLKGSIEPGKLADFLVLSQDIMTVPDEQILETHSLATYVGGRKVFSRPGGSF